MNKLWFPEDEILYLLCKTYGIEREWFGFEPDFLMRIRLGIKLDQLFNGVK